MDMARPKWLDSTLVSIRTTLKSQGMNGEKAAYTSLVQGTGSDDGSLSEDPSSPMLEEQLSLHRLQRPSRVKSWLGRGVLALLTIWAFLSSVLLIRSIPPVDPQTLSCTCGGTTVAEALRRGCIFTPLAIAWLPPHCIDFELSDEFDRAGPGPNGEWEYWADPSRTVPLAREEVGKLADVDGVFYTTQDWHITHCTYTWRKHFRKNVTGVTIERRSNGLDHIWHCEKVFQIRAGLQDIATVAGIALDADDPGETNFDDFDDVEE